MNPIFPRAGVDLIERMPRTMMARDWWYFLRQLWWACGFSHDAPMFVGPLWRNISTNAGGGGTSTVTTYIPIGNNYRDGTAIKLQFAWLPTTANAGDVLWRTGWSYADDGEAFPAMTEEDHLETAPGVTDQMAIVNATDITGTGITKGGTLKLQLSRIGGDASDTYADNATAMWIGIKHEIDGIGWEAANP